MVIKLWVWPGPIIISHQILANVTSILTEIFGKILHYTKRKKTDLINTEVCNVRKDVNFAVTVEYRNKGIVYRLRWL